MEKLSKSTVVGHVDYRGCKGYVKQIFPLGHYCGYVELPASSRLVGLPTQDIDIDVHGGVTFSEQVNDHWTIGFDCAHAGDYVPGLEDIGFNVGAHEWTVPEVENEVRTMIDQVIDLEDEQ